MPLEIDIAEFLLKGKNIPVIDVRSPSEYQKGHISGAKNLPLFSDDERAKVGTLYVKKGKDEAYLLGLELVGPKLKYFAKEATQLAVGGQLLVHCWRGGMRSNSMAWLLEQTGIKAYTLKGGYKAYRHYVQDWFNIPPKLIVLGGMTGSGKTEILNEIGKAGQQVIDLEHIAHHKGSAFGGLGQTNQPTQELFENQLFTNLYVFDYQYVIWVEDESISIGKTQLPNQWFKFMKQAKVICLLCDKETRIKRLMNEYTGFSPELLAGSIKKIEKRLGYDKAKDALGSLLKGDYKTVAEIALYYYDKAYQKQLQERPKENLIHFKPNSELPIEIAKELMNLKF
jgi:tRNA 2-selenouridine synthase